MTFRRPVPAATLLIAFTFPAAAFADNGSITVNAGTRFQTIDGFGTALSGYAPTDGAPYQSLYGATLGASIARVTVDNTVLPAQVTFGNDLQQNVGALDFVHSDSTAKAVAFAKGMKNYQVDDMKMIATIFSPPAWLKTNNSLGDGYDSNGNLIWNDPNNHLKTVDGSTTLDPGNLQQFARFVAAYAAGWQQQTGTPLYAISLANEPRFTQYYASCVYTPAQFAQAVDAVAAQFRQDHLQTKIMGPEDVGWDTGYFGQQNGAFASALAADPVAKISLGLYATHGLAGFNNASNPDPALNEKSWTNFQQTLAPDGWKTWQSEYSQENTAWLHTGSDGNPDGALSVALHIHEALKYGQVSAYLYWQMYEAGNYGGDTLTGGDLADTSYLKFNAARHFFRYIRPGSEQILTSADDPWGLNCDAFFDPTTHQLTIELVNLAGTDEKTTISLQGLADLGRLATFLTTDNTTTPNYWWQTLPDTVVNPDGTVTLTVPADSVMTLTGSASATPEPATGLMLCGGLVELLRNRRRQRSSSR